MSKFDEVRKHLNDINHFLNFFQCSVLNQVLWLQLFESACFKLYHFHIGNKHGVVFFCLLFLIKALISAYPIEIAKTKENI